MPQAKPGKYIPPALRAKMQGDEDAKRKENLARLRRQMKGLINRLAENNMASICNQVNYCTSFYFSTCANLFSDTIIFLLLHCTDG